MKPIFDSTIQEILNNRLAKLEQHFDADVIFYYGSIADSLEKPFRDFIEDLKLDAVKHETLCIILNTPGGSAETLGYLDKVEEMINKSAEGKLTQAELLMLREQDLAMLRRHEQAKELTIALLKEWLVKYKFKNWNFHKDGSEVTAKQKEDRAKEIAKDLGDNKLWHSHGRSIGVSALTHILKLRIEDYSSDSILKSLIREYNDLICEYILRSGSEAFLHSRKFI